MNGCGTCGQGVIQTVAHGVAGLAKAALQIDRTPPSLMELRVRQCVGHPTGGEDAIEPCPAFKAGFFCEDCGCIVAAKLRVASETCPRGRWPVGE